MATLRLAQATTIIDAALAKAREQNFAPLAVAVLDAGGHLIAFKREDGAGIVRFDIAYGKAWGHWAWASAHASWRSAQPKFRRS
jgi:uncharacterized protein GlcG (DUF336 family)